MKHTKKLIPAIGMLLLSASMLVTSTFAWFSMNTTVEATGMQVSAVTDQVFLQIVKDGGTFQNGQIQSVASPDINTTDKLAAVNIYTDDTAQTEFTGGNGTYVWLTTASKNPALSEKDTERDWAVVEDSTLTKYAYKTSYDLRLDPTAGSVAGGRLKVTGVSFPANNTYSDHAISGAVSVLVVCKFNNVTMSCVYKQTTAGTFAAKGNDYLMAEGEKFPASTTKEDKLVEVDVYVFFDGSHSACTTNNATAAKDKFFSVSVGFAI